MQYKLILHTMNNEPCSVVSSAGLAIPFSVENTDYQTFKKDLASGAELQDAEGNVIDGIAYLEELV